MSQPNNSNEMSSSEKSEKKLKPEDILKNWKTLTNAELTSAFKTPELASHAMSIVSKLPDEKLKIVIPAMSLDQIKTTIPKLQLQQTGVAVQVMSPSQIQQTITSLTHDDKNLLMQNISLLSSSSSKDDLQCFMGFVDPLAMAIAIQIPDLAEKIIECCGVMTVEQIRVVVPLLSVKHVKNVLSNLEHDSQIEVAVSMIDTKQTQELTKDLIEQLPILEKKKIDLSSNLNNIKLQLPLLGKKISELSEKTTDQEKEEEYQLIVRNIKSTKSEIELLQQNIREIQAVIKIPFIISLSLPSENSDSEIKSYIERFKQLTNETSELGKEAHSKFTILSANDGLITVLNKQWEQIKPQNQPVGVTKSSSNALNIKSSTSSSTSSTTSEVLSSSPSSSITLSTDRVQNKEESSPTNSCKNREQDKSREQDVSKTQSKEISEEDEEIFVDDDLAVVLYDAIRKIGNPDAIGNHYSITWSDIIQAGFRGETDFKEKGILNLEQLQQFIKKKNEKTK